MNADSFIVYIKTDNIYIDTVEDVETRFDTSNSLPKEKNQKLIGLMKDELRGKIMTKFDTKKCVVKRKPKFENYKNCLEETQLENKIKHLEKK